MGQDSDPDAPTVKWRAKFGDAFRGLKLGIRDHASFFVHFFFAALVVSASLALNCTLVEWCLLLGSIGGVLTAELFLFFLFFPQYRKLAMLLKRFWPSWPHFVCGCTGEDNIACVGRPLERVR